MDRDLNMSRRSLWPLAIFMLLATLEVAAREPLRDPTRPYAWREVTPVVEIPREVQEWHVTAVRIGRHNRSAIVNGRLVHVGEAFAQARVTAIDADAVVLDYQGNTVRVGLLRPVIKRRSGAREGTNQGGSGEQNR